MTLKNVTRIDQVAHEKTWFERFRNKIGATATAVGALAVTSAHAEGLEDVGTIFTGQLTAGQAIVVAILVGAATITAIIIGYKKLNKGANAA